MNRQPSMMAVAYTSRRTVSWSPLLLTILRHCNMHRTRLLLVLTVFPVLFALTMSASILDLLSWDVHNGGGLEKRDKGSDSGAQRACSCNSDPSCTCCVDFNITYIDFGGPGCVHMQYISQTEGIAVNVSYGESLLHSQQVKGPNPEPACISLMGNFAQVCALFSNLHPVENGLKGCLQLEPQLFGQLQTQFDIGCFTMGPDGMKLDSESNSTVIPLLLDENQNRNETQPETEDLNEEDLLATVNETAEQGMALFGEWFDFLGNTETNETNTEIGTKTNSVEASTTITSDHSAIARNLP